MTSCFTRVAFSEWSRSIDYFCSESEVGFIPLLYSFHFPRFDLCDASRGLTSSMGQSLSTTKQFISTFLWGTASLQIAFGSKSYNLRSLLGPSKNANKSICLLQKPGSHQCNSYRIEPYNTFCRGHMTLAFVEDMLSPILWGQLHNEFFHRFDIHDSFPIRWLGNAK